MTKIPKVSSIDLAPYENALLESVGTDPSQGFGAFVRVETPLNGGKVSVQNLWDTANPGRVFGDDGFLSFEEAKGKTFYVPFFFCNNMAHFVIEVKGPKDFDSLKETLWAPLRNERISYHTCLDARTVAKSPPPGPPSPPDPEEERGMAVEDWLQENWDPDLFAENFKNNLFAGSAGFLSPSVLAAALPGAAIKAGVQTFLKGVSEGLTDSPPEAGEEFFDDEEEVEEFPDTDEEFPEDDFEPWG